MILKIGIGFLTVVAVFLIYVLVQPKNMHISRELLVKSPPEVLFPFINNSQKSNEWMPWADIDSQLKMNYTGPSEGLDAASSWDSPGQMGTGKAIIVESILNKSVKTQLTYTKPMQMTQLATVSLIPTAEGTIVRWEVVGENSFIGRMVGVFLNMDKLVGGNFEQGLSKLKTIAEKQ